MSRFLTILAGAALAAGCLAAPAAATTTGPGVQHLHYRFGPLHIAPGQNTIDFAPNRMRPAVPGYITRFAPNLE